MLVWRFRKGVLAFFCGTVTLLVIMTFSPTQDDGLIHQADYTKEENAFKNSRIQTGNPPGRSSTTCNPKNFVMDIAAVVCGTRLPEALNMVKSIIIFTKERLHFHIVAEYDLQDQLKQKLESLSSRAQQHFDFTIYDMKYPPGEDHNKWKKLFKACASQRLFLMNLIQRDKILYLDTDVLVISPVEKLWHHFSKFNETQLAALTPEGEVKSLNWYHRFARHPYYGELGLNSGVMLMHLQRLREINFAKTIIDIYREHKLQIVWGDQDLLNVFFGRYPERVYVYPCEWNYRPDHCIYQNNCESVLRNGAFVLHGNRQVFHNNKQPTFKAIYEILDSFQLGDDIESGIVAKVLNIEHRVSDLYCKLMLEHFVKNMS